MISGVFCGTNACVIDCADDDCTFTPVFAAPVLRAHMHDFVLIRSRVYILHSIWLQQFECTLLN